MPMPARIFPSVFNDKKANQTEFEKAEHALKTPLTGIRSIAEILRDADDITPEQRRRFASAILADEQRLERAVLDFLK